MTDKLAKLYGNITVIRSLIDQADKLNRQVENGEDTLETSQAEMTFQALRRNIIPGAIVSTIRDSIDWILFANPLAGEGAHQGKSATESEVLEWFDGLDKNNPIHLDAEDIAIGRQPNGDERRIEVGRQMLNSVFNQMDAGIDIDEAFLTTLHLVYFGESYGTSNSW